MTALSHRVIAFGLVVLLAFAAPVGAWARTPHVSPAPRPVQAAPGAARVDTPRPEPRVPASEAEATQDTKTVPSSEPSSQAAAEDLAPYNPLDTYSFYLTALFIVFGLGVILLQLAAMRRIANVTADEIARNCAITLVVVASVALLVSGYSSQQVAPAFGLFGTIIGYLLGKAGAKEGQAKPPSQEAGNVPPVDKP